MCRGDPGSGLRAVEARPHAGVLPQCEVVHPRQHDAERATAVAAAVEVVAAAAVAAARGAAEHCHVVVPREQTGVRQRLVVAGDGVPHDEVDPSWRRARGGRGRGGSRGPPSRCSRTDPCETGRRMRLGRSEGPWRRGD